MKKYMKSFLVVFMCLILGLSGFTVSASAASFPPVGDVINWLGGADLVLSILERLKNLTSDSSFSCEWIAVQGDLEAEGTRAETTRDTLESIAYDWNMNYASEVGFNVGVVQVNTSTGAVYSVIRCYLKNTGGGGRGGSGRPAYYFADGYGRILCSDDTTETDGTWVPIRQLKSPYYMLSRESLYNLATSVGGVVKQSGGMYFIQNTLGTNVYVSCDGLAFAAWSYDDQSAINQDRETTSGTVTEGGTTTTITNENNDYSHNIDIENMTQVLPGGTVNNIDSLIYDAATKTYYSNSYYIDQSDNRTYNFTVNQYHINYTSITYIGQTVEYEKHYELYYELPDGRDSADLTATDLEQLSTSFKDVMNYARSADDLNQRVLYHFDGNTEDSSYWSYCTDFHWNSGASLTYMDEGTFGGSLYLDETKHEFTITLPGASDLAGDWTLQFRYYQSYTAAPVFDSGIWIGSSKLVAFNGAEWGIDGLGNKTLSVGSWNELCFVRKDGVLSYYVNGVFYGSISLSTTGNDIWFLFGSEQQTYKKLDELRFTRGAIYTPGENYTPTSVPYDSNLILVLPDSRIPVADEVMVLTPSENNFFNDTYLADFTKDFVIHQPRFPLLGDSNSLDYSTSDFARLYRDYNYTGLLFESGVTDFFANTTEESSYNLMYDQYNVEWLNTALLNGLYLPVCGYWLIDGRDYRSSYCIYTPGVPYTLSVVLADGSTSYCTFVVQQHGYNNYSLSIINSVVSSPVTFSVLDLKKWGQDHPDDPDPLDWYVHRFGINVVAPVGSHAQLLYMELVQGSEPQFTITYEGAVYDPVQLTESPVLAVRSNLPITTYQIGGVRPSYPQKGQVYAMVERGYITSLQQYTGSAWESVDGRIWTGSRWIPASSYNVITLQDMYDIVDSTPEYEYIYSESGFWDWFQRAWKDLIARLDKIIDGQKGSSGGGSVTDETLPPVSDNTETDTDEGWSAYDLLIVIKDGTWSFITGVISTGFDGLVGFTQGFSHIAGFFDAYDADSSANVLGITNYGGSDIWD